MVGIRDRVPKKYAELPEAVQDYFGGFPSIFNIEDKYAWDVIIAYIFMEVERAQHSIVYCAMVKKHRVHKDVAQGVLNNFHMKRETFPRLYKILGGTEIDKTTLKLAKDAEKVRDKILHGNDKKVSVKDKKDAIISIFEYSNILNEQAFDDFKFRPFGNLTGFNAKGKTYDKEPSRWIIMGIMSQLNRSQKRKNPNQNKPQTPTSKNAS